MSTLASSHRAAIYIVYGHIIHSYQLSFVAFAVRGRQVGCGDQFWCRHPNILCSYIVLKSTLEFDFLQIAVDIHCAAYFNTISNVCELWKSIKYDPARFILNIHFCCINVSYDTFC
ncbi:hypothetical protein D3C75_679160 [compost metagenome]